jgi:ACS family glucarate transporter-like MFS transporter
MMPWEKERGMLKVSEVHGRPATSRVRWQILALLACFSLISYLERINLTVAAKFIRDEFGLTDVQIGWSFSAFLIGYTLAQIPVGHLMDRYGSHRVLTIAAFAWAALTLLLGFSVGFLATTPTQVVLALVVTRFLLGLAESPTYPGAAATISRWFPPGKHGTPNAVIQSASYAGEALTLALFAGLVVLWGWRNALYASALPAFLLAIAWWRFGRSSPAEHPRVSEEELRLIGDNPQRSVATGGTLKVLKDRNIAVLSLSYFLQGYVLYLFFFWFYIYLVDERGFSIAGGGLYGALPTIAAAVLALAGGPMSDRLARNRGGIAGRRILVLVAGLIGGAAILLGAFATGPMLAIAGFTIAVGTRGLVESSYWSTAIEIGKERSGLVSGAMNSMSNVGGAVSTALAPVLVAAFGWPIALSVAAGATAFSGIILFAMRTEKESAARAG